MHQDLASHDELRGASRAFSPLLVAALVLVTVASSVRADTVTEIRTPSTQTLTDFTQTGGTFAACAENIDGTTCDYQEGDDGTGGTINPMLLPNGQGTLNDWTAVGCAEGAEWDCVNDGPSHDSDTTYVSATQTLATIVSEYEMQDCTGQAWCVAGQTVSNVVAWTFARFVAGVNTDPGILIEVYQGGTFCHGASLNQALTTSYVNYSSTANTCSWTTLNLDTLRTRITTSCSLTPCDQERATAVGATVTITQPNYRGTFQYDFVNVLKAGGAQSDLVIRMAVAAGETWSCDVFDWLTNSYDAGILTFTSTSQTTQTYALEEEHVSGGGAVRFRCVDGNTSGDTTQDTISVDAAFVRTTWDDSPPPGGGALGELLTLGCTPTLTEMRCALRLSDEAQGVSIERTSWYMDGEYRASGAAVTNRLHSASWDSFDFPLGAHSITILIDFSNGQTFDFAGTVAVDNLWLLLVIVFSVAGAVVLVALPRGLRAVRRTARREEKAERRKQANRGPEEWRLRVFGGGGK